jgi:hypothetical protein
MVFLCVVAVQGIAESFTTVEATAPPAQVHGRDEVQRGAA